MVACVEQEASEVKQASVRLKGLDHLKASLVGLMVYLVEKYDLDADQSEISIYSAEAVNQNFQWVVAMLRTVVGKQLFLFLQHCHVIPQGYHFLS